VKAGDKCMYKLPTRKNDGWREGRVQEKIGDLYRVTRPDEEYGGILFYREELLSWPEWKNLVNANK